MVLQNKTAIITGVTGSLGRVVAQHFFDAGANIAVPVHARSSAPSFPESMAKGADRFLAVQADLTSESQVQAFVKETLGRFGGIHFLANIAGGYAGGKSVAEVSLDDWEKMMAMNLKSVFLLSRAVLPTMLNQRFGRIVNIASMQALSPKANNAAYAVSKRGVVTLTETIAEEVKGSDVTANALAPSIIMTEANKQSMPNADHTQWVTPKEIAETMLFLCSDSARSINGNVIKIYGGV